MMEASSNLIAAWGSWMLHSTWQVAVLAAVVWGISSLFRKTSASFRHALWLLVFVKLLVPPFIAAPWSVGTVAQQVAEAGGYTATASALGPAPIPEGTSQSVPQRVAVSLDGHSASDRPAVPLNVLFFGIWAFISGAMLATVMVQFLRFRHLALRGCLEAPNWLRQLAEERAGALGLRRSPRVRITGAMGVPAVIGAWRPVILIPGEWLETFDRDALANILTHELAHVKRRDLAVGWLASCLTCCYWFHPLVWVAHLQLRREREMACDDLVLRSTQTDGKDYAGTILKGAEAADGMIPAGAGFLGLMELSENLLQRIRNAGDSARRRRMGLRSMLALGVLAIGLIPMQAISNAQPATPEDTPATSSNRESELALYEKAHPEVQAFIKHTCESFGQSELWLDVGARDGLSAEEREKKIAYIAGVLEGEYGLQQCESLAEAGVIYDARLLPGLKKVAAYHRDDQDYDCRAKWMAVAALGRQGDESAVPVLIPLVDHGNLNTRMWARGSLVRLTRQTFDQDKAAWGAWWNAQDKEPQLTEDDLKPWVMPGTQVPAQTAAPDGRTGAIKSTGASIEGGGELTGKEAGIELLDIKEGNGKWRARLKTAGLKKWYEAGEAFEAFRLESINPEEKSVVVFEERLGKSITLRLPGVVSEAEGTPEVAPAAPSEPEILESSPALGTSEVDPSLDAITVTFDQDMGGGFSWTGGGELYPETTGKPEWIDKRTCKLPVKLQEGRVYRVGINSKSYKNFRGANGVPARDRVLYFATKGADPDALAGLTPPKVVSKVVGEARDKLLVTFDKPMGGGCSWTKAGGVFPEVTDKISWSEDKKTCTLPVKLEAGKTYRVGINSRHAINFQSESGVPCEPEVWEFTVE